MSLQITDTIFTRQGDPLIIKKKDAQTGKVWVERDSEKIQEELQSGIKNGLGPTEKDQFRSVAWNEKELNAKEKIESLHHKIEELKSKPNEMSARTLRYLESELSYLMNKNRYFPENYAIEESKISK